MKKLVLSRIFILLTTSSICSLLLLASALGCSQENAREISFQQLFSNPSQYHGKKIIIKGFYFDGFEVQVIAESLDYSGYAEGHLVPKGEMIWVEGGIPGEVYDRLYRQQMMGPEERYGKARVTGRFEYGNEYGHAGGYQQQIIPERIELLPWSPPPPPSATSTSSFESDLEGWKPNGIDPDNPPVEWSIEHDNESDLSEEVSIEYISHGYLKENGLALAVEGKK